MRLFRHSLVCLAILNAPFLQAESMTDQWSVNGFGTLGVTTTNAPDMGYRTALDTDHVVYDDLNFSSRSLIGVQSNYRWNPQWSANAQIIKKSSTDNFNEALQLGMLIYEPSPSWRFQVGRFAPKLSMFTDNVNVNYSQLWTHSPVEYYGQYLIANSDGAEVTYTAYFDDMTLRNIFMVGHTKSQYMNQNFDPELIGDLGGYTAELTQDDWTWRASIYMLKQKADWYPSSLMNGLKSAASMGWSEANYLYDQLDVDGAQVQVYSLGVAYAPGNWLMQAEISKLLTNRDSMLDTVSGYASVGYQINEWTPYVIYSRIHSTNEPYQLKTNPPAMFNSLAQNAVAALQTQYEQSSLGVGLRWDINSHFSVKTQWERVFVAAENNVLWWNDTNNDRQVDAVTLNVDFIF